MRSGLAEKPLYWIGSSKKDLLTFPPEMVELVESSRGATFRAVYAVRFASAIYGLHCFQKKSPSGIRTAQSDVEPIHERLKAAQQHYKDLHER